MSRRAMSSRAGRASLRALVALGSLAVAAAAAPAQPAAPPAADAQPAAISPSAGRCGVCHPAERVAFEQSRHSREDVRCVSCHGGNDRSLTLSVAHGSGFKGRPARRDIPRLCASCHANEQKMRPYNLPVDQYALYQTSGHGIHLARGDTRVAVCSDCHGAHDILPPEDPASSVFPVNIPKTCGKCHGDTTLMRARGLSNVYQDYEGSVHARALFDKGNLRAPTCVSCHGAHGAAPPNVGDVDKVCGQCHTAERRYFAAGPHRQGMMAAGLPECASCHGYHKIPAAEPKRLAGSCVSCHGAKSSQETIGQEMWTSYRAAVDEIDKAEALTAKADAIPLQTEDYRARLEVGRTYLRESLPASHSVQEDVVAGFTTRARAVGQEVESDIYGKLGNLRTRRFVLILFWFYLLLTILVLKRFRDRGAGAS